MAGKSKAKERKQEKKVSTRRSDSQAGNELLLLWAILGEGGGGDVSRSAYEKARTQQETADAQVNAARAVPRRCGTTAFPAVAPLALSQQLSQIAAGHSVMMSARDGLMHQDPDGSTPADRVRRGGYDARIVGENVASGAPTATEVVAGWLASPGHCANIMDARFTEMGIAYVVAPRSGGAIYWTQLLAARRS